MPFLWKRKPRLPDIVLDKVLCKRLGLPRPPVHWILRRAKRWLCHQDWKAHGQVPPVRSDNPLPAMTSHLGYSCFDASVLSGWDQVQQLALEYWRSEQRSAVTLNPKKTFLHTLAVGDDFLAHPEWLSFMLDRSLLERASEYLGSVPVLGGAALWWTPPNESSIRSQLWHLDEEDRHQVKLLVNITATGPEAGPFKLLSREFSERIERCIQTNRVLGRYRRLGRLPDIDGDPEVIEKTISLTGGPGSAALVDTCRCLHYGSRGNRTDRLVLMVQYLPFDTPLTSTYAFQRRKPPPHLELDRLQRQVLEVY